MLIITQGNHDNVANYASKIYIFDHQAWLCGFNANIRHYANQVDHKEFWQNLIF